MKTFKYWLMPENKIKGSNNKWEAQDDIEASSRKSAANTVREKLGLPLWTRRGNMKSKDGQWKLRLAQ